MSAAEPIRPNRSGGRRRVQPRPVARSHVAADAAGAPRTPIPRPAQAKGSVTAAANVAPAPPRLPYLKAWLDGDED